MRKKKTHFSFDICRLHLLLSTRTLTMDYQFYVIILFYIFKIYISFHFATTFCVIFKQVEDTEKILRHLDKMLDGDKRFELHEKLQELLKDLELMVFQRNEAREKYEMCKRNADKMAIDKAAIQNKIHQNRDEILRLEGQLADLEGQ